MSLLSRARSGWMNRATAAAVLLICLPGIASGQTESAEYYALDAIGSVRVVFDAGGAVIARQDFEPFGREVTASQGGPHRRYAALFRDSEAGLDYAEARSYQVRTGRFSGPDPLYAGLFEPQRWNRYAYSLNNTLRYVDPTGLSADSGAPNPSLCTAEVQAQNPNDFHCGGAVGLSTYTSSSYDFSWFERTWANGAAGTSASGGSAALDAVQLALDVASIALDATGAGVTLSWVPDTVNAAISATRGDSAGAVASLAAAVPMIGASANVGKIVSNPLARQFISAWGTVVPVPGNWLTRSANNGKSVVYQAPGAAGNQNMIRIAEPDTMNPDGYVRIYNSQGQPLTATGQIGSNKDTHIPLTYQGTIRWPW